MRYFRYFPWGMQLLLFLLLSFTFSSFGLWLVGILAPKLTGYPLTAIAHISLSSPYLLIKTNLLVIGVFSLLRFAVSAASFSYLTHPRPASYLGFRKPAHALQVLLSIVVVVAAIPLLEYVQHLVGLIDFGKKVKDSQAENEAMMQALLNIPNAGAFALTILMLAIIPGIGEELFFRSLLMKFAFKATRRFPFAILFTAFIFAASHSNLYGMLSIFLAGALLGCVYYLTASIWCSIAAHITFNSVQIFLAYYSTHGSAQRNAALAADMPLWLVVGATVVAGIAGFLLYKQRTPLVANWASDFDENDTQTETLFPTKID